MKTMDRYSWYIMEAFASELTDNLQRQIDDVLGKGLQSGDFKYNITIEFADGSKAVFKSAFYVEVEKGKVWVVFTKNNGHHLFPSEGNKIRAEESR